MVGVGGWWRLVALSGGWQLVVSGGWQLAAVGDGWQLVVSRHRKINRLRDCMRPFVRVLGPQTTRGLLQMVGAVAEHCVCFVVCNPWTNPAVIAPTFLLAYEPDTGPSPEPS